MAKHQRPSLEAFAQPFSAAESPAPSAQVVELKQQEAPQAQVEQGASKARVRNDAAHTTLYLDKAVRKVIKEIALHFDRKPHDLYLEGIELMLAHYGRPSLKELAE